MKTLICAGTLFSNWQQVAAANLAVTTSHAPIAKGLSALNEKICRQQFPDTDELNWGPFSPDDVHAESAHQLLSSIQDEPLFWWADGHCSLCLDFWNSVIENSDFLLFYSSPECELSNYINTHPFTGDCVENVMKAWLVRTRAMLAFFMSNRSQCLLVNVQSAASEQGMLQQALGSQFKLQPEIKPATADEKPNSPVMVEYLATSLLLGNETVAELYDEVRSAATVIDERDKSMPDIQSRSKSLINAVLEEASSFRQLSRSNKELEEELLLKHLQISQVMEELEYYYKSNREQGEVFAKYLSSDPLLNTARQARKSQ